MDEVAKYGSLLFLMSAICAVAAGKLSDHWIRSGTTPTRMRKGCLVLGASGVGVCLALAAVTQGAIFIVMLALTGAFLGIGACSTWAVTQTLAGPSAAGRWTGVQNFIGNFAGWTAPMLTGYLLDRTGRYEPAFFVTAAIAWVGALSWGLIVGPIEPVNWAQNAPSSAILASPAAGATIP